MVLFTFPHHVMLKSWTGHALKQLSCQNGTRQGELCEHKRIYQQKMDFLLECNIGLNVAKM